MEDKTQITEDVQEEQNPEQGKGKKKKEKIEGKDYTSDNIQVLEGIEHVRKRPSMYIGDISSRGLHHLVYEVVDNSIDEALAGYCDRIEIIIHKDDSVSILDNGRGIPVESHKKEGKPAVEVIMTTLYSGGKFDSQTYKVSGGLHGVGVSVVNALSKWLEVEVYREGKAYHQSYKKGIKATELKELGSTDKEGTKVTFKPDGEIFEETSFSFDILAKRLRELAFLNKGLEIVIVDDRVEEKSEEYCYEGGIKSFVAHLNENKNVYHENIFYFEKEEEEVVVEVAFQYNDSYGQNIYSFANNIHTYEGGTHLSGFKAALTGSINRYGKSEKILKDFNLSGDDVREGITAIISVKIPDPQFEGQTKTKLGNREVQGLVESIVNEQLSIFLEENPSTAKTIINKAKSAAKAREAAKRARDLARRKNALQTNSLPGKLADCTSQNVDETELYIVEGESAGGSAKQGRNRHFQAILPLKGKILNVEKANPLRMLKHSEIQTIITALGTGIDDEFNLENNRYGKIIIMTDADVDGHHIRTLLLTFFFRHMPQLIENGHVYIANPPLYKVSRNKFEKYYHSEKAIRLDLFDYSAQYAILTYLPTEQKLEGEVLKGLLQLLSALEEQAKTIEQRGINFSDYLRLDNDEGHLPLYFIRHENENLFFYSTEELDQFIEEQKEEIEEDEEGKSQFDYDIIQFHECREIEENFKTLEEVYSFSVADYAGRPKAEEEDFFRIDYDGKETEEIHSLRDLVDVVFNLAQKNQNIQRFKGLGEMNPEQLWETTMDPTSRTLYRVTVEDRIEPDKIFSILMGSEVEPRREFIEKHALEVKRLDV